MRRDSPLIVLEEISVVTCGEFILLLREVRERSGLSIRQLAKKLGVSHGYVHKITSEYSEDYLPSDKYCIKRFITICGVCEAQQVLILDIWQSLNDSRVR